MHETIGLIMMGCLAFAVCVAALAMVFMFIDMIFGHRISDSLTSWYERKFRVE
jgi:hypothetical protein